MNLARLRARLAEIQGRLTEIRALESVTEEIRSEAETLLVEARAVQRDIASLTEMEGLDNTVNELRNTSAGRSSGEENSHEQRGEEQVDEDRSIGALVTESEEYRAWAENRSRTTFRFEFETRALQTAASTPPTGFIRPQRVRGIDVLSEPYGSLRDVLLVGSTNAESLEFFREDTFTNNAAFVGEATATTGSSGAKPESAITYDRDTATVGTIAHWIPVTNQFEWAAPELRSLIDGRLIDGLNRVEDELLLTGDGSGNDPVGLLGTNGIQVLDTTYFTGATTVNAGTEAEIFDRIARAKRLVSDVGRARANFVIINPEDDEIFSTLMDANGHYYGGGPYVAGLANTFWGLRKVVSEYVPAGEAVVGDGRYAQVWDRMQANIQVGYINDQFARNMKTILAEKRVGLAVYRPAAFAHVTLVDA